MVRRKVLFLSPPSGLGFDFEKMTDPMFSSLTQDAYLPVPFSCAPSALSSTQFPTSVLYWLLFALL